MSGYFDNAFYNTNNNTGWDNLGNPMMYDPARLTPQNTNALSEEEIKHIAQKPVNKLDINISQDDNLRSMCTHKHNGQDMVRRIEDGSGDVYCPLCGARWSPNPVSEEELQSCCRYAKETFLRLGEEWEQTMGGTWEITPDENNTYDF